MVETCVVIEVAMLLWRIGQHVVAKFIMTLPNMLRQLIKVRATIKTCLLCVDLQEPTALKLVFVER